jgi:peptide deformylase
VAIRDILEIPHPLLRQRAKRVRRADKRLLALAYDMVETMRDAGGVGLAANQVGELRRLIVIQLPEEEEARIYINPEILRQEGQREVEEGCLSYPGYKGIVNRSMWVKFGALDHTETAVEISAECLLAQALEHEVDHLNGILYLDHLADHSNLYPVDEDGERLDEEEDDQPQADPPDSNASVLPDDAPASLTVR